jgi:hypothetical protein
MKESLAISKQGMIRILAVCYQGARSIDAALHPSQSNWVELTRYYSADKRAIIKSAIADLGFASASSIDVNRKDIQYDTFSRLFPFLNYICNKFRRRWFIPKDVHLFLASCLERLSKYLECEQQPAQEQLIQLRLDLTAAGSYLDNRLVGITDLLAIRNIEYYASPIGKLLRPIHEVAQVSKKL